MGLPTLGCKAGVGEGTDGAKVSCIFTVDCDRVSREREAYVRVRRRDMSNTKSTINEILSEYSG